MRRIITAEQLAQRLGISAEEVFQIARTQQVPWSMTGTYGGFIHEDDLDIWKVAVRRNVQEREIEGCRAPRLLPGCLLIGGHATFLRPAYEAAPLRRY